jgi:flagellar biosynthesis protein FlhA
VSLVDEHNTLRIVTLSPALEQEILEAIKRSEGSDYIPVPPQRAQQICENTAQAIQRLVLEGYEPIVVCTANVRRFFHRIIERKLPKVRVLSYNEIDSSVKVEMKDR